LNRENGSAKVGCGTALRQRNTDATGVMYRPLERQATRMTSASGKKQLWYRKFRGAAFASAAGILVWTVAMALPFQPFSYLPPIIVGGGPGTWFLLAYLLALAVGVAGFGTFSSFLQTIEIQESRSVSPSAMWPAFILLCAGFASSCLLLAVAGASGGYASTISNASGTSVEDLLRPFVYPVTASTLTAVVGAALALYAMIRAGWPAV